MLCSLPAKCLILNISSVIQIRDYVSPYIHTNVRDMHLRERVRKYAKGSLWVPGKSKWYGNFRQLSKTFLNREGLSRSSKSENRWFSKIFPESCRTNAWTFPKSQAKSYIARNLLEFIWPPTMKYFVEQR